VEADPSQRRYNLHHELFLKFIITKCIVFKKHHRVGYSVAGTCCWDGLGLSVWAPPGAKSPLRVKSQTALCRIHFQASFETKKTGAHNSPFEHVWRHWASLGHQPLVAPRKPGEVLPDGLELGALWLLPFKSLLQPCLQVAWWGEARCNRALCKI